MIHQLTMTKPTGGLKAKEINKRKQVPDAFPKGTDKNGTVSQDAKYDEPMNIMSAFTILQKGYPQFTENNLRDEMFGFYCTGTDTVGSSTASCLLILAYYPDIQERLHQEISSVMGPEDDVTVNSLNRMPYLDQVVKETLRWFLTVPFVMRKVKKDIALSSFTVPAGSSVTLSLASIHMDPKLYPDPNTFDPGRFSLDSSGKQQVTFIPFSAGPRNCIAKNYATQLMKIMVVHVVRKYRLCTMMDVLNLRKKLVVTLVNADGYNISFEPRNSETNKYWSK